MDVAEMTHLEQLAAFSGRVATLSEYVRGGRITAEGAMDRIEVLVRELTVSKAYEKWGDLK